MVYGYENIKLIYEEIWRSYEHIPGEFLGSNFEEFVSSVYDTLVMTKYTGHEKFALHGLKISSEKLKELILDTIFSNLYCEFVLMLQNLNEYNFAIKHEVFLTSVECNKKLDVNVSRSFKERFRRRMQPNRLNLISKVKIKNTDKTTFYSPSLIRAFKEALFIPRPNTEILDISEVYADIFYSLMIDSDEQASSKECKIIREKIKSHRLWELNKYDVNYISRILLSVINNDNDGDILAQLMLLEKLYGLYSIADLWTLKVDEEFDDFTCILFFALSSMRRLGYCRLHKQLIDLITLDSTDPLDIKDVVDTYIYPICTDILKKVLKTVLKLLENCDNDQRFDILIRLMRACLENNEIVFSDKSFLVLQEIPPQLLVEAIQGINRIVVEHEKEHDMMFKLLGVVKLIDAEGMKAYLKIPSTKSYKEQFYDLKYKNIDYKLLFDISSYDLTFTKKHTVSKQELRKIFNPNSKHGKK